MKRIIIPERWERIIDLVERQGSATVERIGQVLGISPATVRRDLARIQQRGLIERTRGGAAPSQRMPIGPTLAESRRINPAEKELLGRTAAELVEAGDTVTIDGGFTTFQLARHIAVTDLRVVTNSFDVLQALVGRPGITLMMIGGELLAESQLVAWRSLYPRSRLRDRGRDAGR